MVQPKYLSYLQTTSASVNMPNANITVCYQRIKNYMDTQGGVQECHHSYWQRSFYEGKLPG